MARRKPGGQPHNKNAKGHKGANAATYGGAGKGPNGPSTRKKKLTKGQKTLRAAKSVLKSSTARSAILAGGALAAHKGGAKNTALALAVAANVNVTADRISSTHKSYSKRR